MSFFKPEDFNDILISPVSWKDLTERLAHRANLRLSERGVRVYGDGNSWDLSKYLGTTHQAFVVCIEELPKKLCEHKPALSLRLETSETNFARTKEVWKCAVCGVELKWSAVE